MSKKKKTELYRVVLVRDIYRSLNPVTFVQIRSRLVIMHETTVWPDVPSPKVETLYPGWTVAECKNVTP